MYALDTNILVYAHNTGAKRHTEAKKFVQQVMNQRDKDGNLTVCKPSQVLIEFMNVITWSRLEAPLPLQDAIQVVKDYLATGVTILHPLPTQLDTLLKLLKNETSRKKVFDIALVAILKDHKITGIYTVNTKDFKHYSFLDVKNPL